MRLKFRLRIRLLLLLWGIFFLALFLPSLYYNKYLKDEILSETEARASRELTLIKDLMAREEFQGPEQLHAWLRRVSDPLKRPPDLCGRRGPGYRGYGRAFRPDLQPGKPRETPGNR